MVRLAVLLVLIVLTVWEWRSGVRKYVYGLTMLGLFVFFSLRYGQGTDYLTYMSIYATVPPLQTLPNFGAYQYNTIEIGFFYLISFFRMLGVHYVLFIAIINAFSLLCLHRFISRFSPLPVFAVTVFFAVYSLTYMESGIRQLVALSIAMGWVYVDWANAKRVRAIIGILVASLMHTSAALLLVLPVFFWTARPLFVIEWKRSWSAPLLGALLAASAVINFVDLTPIITRLPDSLSYRILTYYASGGNVSLMALLNRSVFMLIIFALAFRARAELSDGEKLLYNLYCVGYAIYVLFMSFELIASRTNVYFRVVEVALLPLLLYKNRELVRRTVVALPVMLMLLAFLYIKDITAIMGFAQYYSSNPLQYPYITVFNSDAIFESKYINVKNANAMNAYQTGGLTWDEYYESLLRKPNIRSPILPY